MCDCKAFLSSNRGAIIREIVHSERVRLELDRATLFMIRFPSAGLSAGCHLRHR
jgi:hypothetical protein